MITPRHLPNASALILAASLVAGCGASAPAPSASATPTAQVIILVATPTPGSAPDPVEALEAGRIAVYDRVAPAVVNVTTQVLRPTFFWSVVPEEGSGSGFLWDAQGHVVTNYHVIEGAQQIAVSFGDELARPASVVGTDPINDLAVLLVEEVPSGARPIELGDSDELRVGQTAIAIGNPFGQFERTMTVGVISALDRTIELDNTILRGVIQTDAAINRGNSGGPLLDRSGRLIGVNTVIYSPSGASAGVGLAVPVNKVKRVAPALIAEGRYPHPWLGVEELGYEITPALARTLDLPAEEGLLIARMYRDSPAALGGLQGARQEVAIGNRLYLVGGDILTAIDDQPLRTWDDLDAYLDEQTEVGQTVRLSVIRDGEPQALTATLQDTPNSLQ
jgi:S1-C subfamily serine protease